MARSYTKTRRAESEAETRLRIADAALALHGDVGPNRTTISMIAERAGVQRHTVYAHFPDEHALLMACSGLHAEREPLPSPAQWSRLEDPRERLCTALAALYGWFARNEAMTASVLRDAEQNETLRQIMELRFSGPLGAIFASLDGDLTPRQKAALSLAMSFFTWRTLSQGGLNETSAVDLMADTVLQTH